MKNSTTAGQLGPAWLRAAWTELGQRERDGPAANARILAFYRDAGHADIRNDDVAWCAAFTGAMLARSGLAPTQSLLARSYLAWGETIVEPRFGAIAVFTRGADPGAGHVGFVVGENADHFVILGGNQSDAVTVALFPRARLLGLRWPSADATVHRAKTIPPIQVGAGSPPAGFASALDHVLSQEGGYTDDPLDPGGPTNRGLTLVDITRHRGIALTADNRDQLIADLGAITDAELTAIYRQYYWRPAACDALPPWLALFHFDTAVNMGIGTAIRMLQAACGVTVDGELGPQTLQAVTTANPDTLLAAYANLRRARYRSLSTFSRFGRGWLNRVDRTLATSLSLAKPKGTRSMTNSSATSSPSDSEAKWWGNSTTIWGAVITGLAAVLPAIGPAIGIEIGAGTITQSAEQIGAIVQAATGLAGTILAIFGRVRAVRPIARREIKLPI
ncbi:MAG: TIGR02594 family protein [Hyphomicrobium aestuarii]|nr:TIGR02594 family protein [Hyphomicrobium aestuarii]